MWRILDLTDERGLLCGKILADLGADVIKVERPGGDQARLIGPFLGDEAHPETSLSWLAFNANKRAITLDLRSSVGRDIFLRLVDTAHAVVESSPPGTLEGMDLGYARLSSRRPSLVLTSITGFGQTGPHSRLPAPDIVVAALSGYMYLCGTPDRAPLRLSFPQSYLHASAAAAVGTLMALYRQGVTGKGQHVDVSAQEAVWEETLGAEQAWDMSGIVQGRTGNFFAVPGGVSRRCTFRCLDGWVTCLWRSGGAGAKSMNLLVQWMNKYGTSERLKAIDWATFDATMASQEEVDAILDEVGWFFARFDKQTLYEEAVARGIVLYPVFSTEDIAGDAQLRERRCWVQQPNPHHDQPVTYLGPWARGVKGARPAHGRSPTVGEHNAPIYLDELGISQDELTSLAQRGIV